MVFMRKRTSKASASKIKNAIEQPRHTKFWGEYKKLNNEEKSKEIDELLKRHKKGDKRAKMYLDVIDAMN